MDRDFGIEELIVLMLQGRASPFDVARCEEWRRAAPENERRYREVERIWSLSEPEPLAGLPPDPSRVVSLAGRAARVAVGRRWGLRTLAAAAVVAAVTLGVQRVIGPGDSGGVAALRSPSGQVLTVELADGSVVRLAGSSSLDFDDGPDARVATLTGRALFAVAPESDRPFLVRTARGQVRVTGTRFEVAVGQEEIRTVVLDGVVELAANGGRVRVSRGQVAGASGQAPPSATEAVDVHALLDWAGGYLIFRATPLTVVAEDVGRWFGVDVRIADPDLSERTITGNFVDASLDDVVGSVCAVLGAECFTGSGAVQIGAEG